jgi:hypothetical protein
MTDFFANIEASMATLSNLLRDATPEQRQTAGETLYAETLASVVDYPGCSVEIQTRRVIESGDGVRHWLNDNLNSLVYGASTFIRHRGAAGLWTAGTPDGKQVSQAVYEDRCRAAIGWLSQAADALRKAGAVDLGRDQTDAAFAAAGGSVSWL